MQNVAATSNKRSMKNDHNPATAHHTITTARRPDNICSSILVRGRSIRSMACSGRQLRRPLPRKDSHFRHFGGLRLDMSCHTGVRSSERKPDRLQREFKCFLKLFNVTSLCMLTWGKTNHLYLWVSFDVSLDNSFKWAQPPCLCVTYLTLAGNQISLGCI